MCDLKPQKGLKIKIQQKKKMVCISTNKDEKTTKQSQA